MSVLCWKCVYALVSPTIECEGLGEGQNSDVPAVVINVSIYKGQVAAVVNNGLHLRHVSIDWLIIDGAQQHTPAINKAIPPSMENFFLVFAQTHNIFHYYTIMNTDWADIVTLQQSDDESSWIHAWLWPQKHLMGITLTVTIYTLISVTQFVA